MKVVLLKEVQGIGHAGDIKEVKDGYARNYLIPAGLADILTKHTLGMLEAQKKKQERSKRQEVGSKKLLAKKIKGQKFTIEVKADEKGTLFAGLDAKAIAEEFKKQKYNVDEKEIILDKAIKKVGEYKVELKLGGEKVIVKLLVSSSARLDSAKRASRSGKVIKL